MSNVTDWYRPVVVPLVQSRKWVMLMTGTGIPLARVFSHAYRVARVYLWAAKQKIIRCSSDVSTDKWTGPDVSRIFIVNGRNAGYLGKDRVGRTLGTFSREGKCHQNMDRENIAKHGSCAYSKSWYGLTDYICIPNFHKLIIYLIK